MVSRHHLRPAARRARPPTNRSASDTASQGSGRGCPASRTRPDSGSGRPTGSPAQDLVRAVRDRVRADAGLAVGPGVEERRALRRADPLVEVAGVPGGAEPIEVEGQHARRVRAVDERLDPALGERGDDPLDRKHERRRARDVADQCEPRPSVTAPRMASTTASSDATGNGIGATTTRAPSRSATWRRTLMVALYSWSSVRSSSPGANRSERSTALTAPVALATNARSSGSAPMNAPSSRARVGQEAWEVAGEELDRLRLHPVAPARAAPRARRAGTRRTSRG